MYNKKTLFSISIILFFIFDLAAQPKDNSPYSRYGIGDINNDNFIFSQGFGSLGATVIDPFHVNLVNPASFAYLKSTAFDVGLDMKYSNLKSNTESGDVYSGNINYFSLGLPLINPINDVLERKKRTYDFGLVFALKPHSTIGYNVRSTEIHSDLGVIERSYVGKGGSYKFMTGLGGRYKNFSFGFNAGYLFGNINYKSLVYFRDIPYAYNDDFNETFSLSGFLYNVGALYSFITNKSAIKKDENTLPNKLIFGVYGNTSTSFKASGDVFYRGVLTSFNLGNLGVDTLYLDENKSGKGVLPGKVGGGIAYHHGKKFIIGANYEQTFWSQYSNEVKLGEEDLLDAYMVSIGIDFVPNHLSYTNTFERMHYRLGAYYQTDGRSENGNQFSEAAVNLGFGVPFVFKRKTSQIDLSLSFGRSMGDRLISESFVKFGLGLTFNDQEWFLKRRYY